MTADIRAKVFCNLGEVISGGWSDDLCQGTGLIRCRGEVVLKGARAVAPGTAVQLAYLTNAGASQFPRQFRVISCFADPYRRTTSLQLGCTLTYLENIKPATDKDRYFYSKEDDNNKDRECRIFDVALLPISAANIARRCMSALGITGTVPLTNWYAAERFDLGEGYVSVLSELLYVEGCVGYMRDLTTLEVVNINASTASAAVASEANLIDLGPINSGEPATDAIAVRYSYTRYKEPDTNTANTPDTRWELEEQYSEPKLIEIEYPAATGEPAYYRALTVDYSRVETTWDRFNRPLKRVETTVRHLGDVNGSYIQKLLTAKELYPSINPIIAPVINITEEYSDYANAAEDLEEAPEETALECLTRQQNSKFFNPDTDAQPIAKRTYSYVSDTEIAGSLPIEQYHFIDPTTQAVTVFHPGTTANRLARYTEVRFEAYREPSFFANKKDNPDLDITKVITANKQALFTLQTGQQLAASETFSLQFEGGTQIQNIINRMALLYNTGVSVQTTTTPDFGVERRPSVTELADLNNQKGLRTVEDTTKLEFLVGDETSRNVRIYDLPLAPDDRVRYLGGGYPGSWSIVQSDHKQKAVNFGRAQQRIAFGHRNGLSIQLPALDMPPYPLNALAVRAAGSLGAYRVDGLSWSFDANGIVCNADCLAWGALGLV